jgi:hypothetical protein
MRLKSIVSIKEAISRYFVEAVGVIGLQRGKYFTKISSIEAKKVPYKPCALGNYSLAIDHSPPVENLASLVNGFLIHVVVSHRHLHVTVA